jgi:[ribosomal protein S18]-alanine N-acetyltransferase
VRRRPATSADVAGLAELEQELFGADAWSPGSVREEVEARRVVVAEDQGRVVGYVVTLAAGDVVDLLRIAVAPTHRRRGLARSLLGEVPAGARVLLEVEEGNDGARAFYAAEGFVEVARRERYYRDGSAAVVLERAATSPEQNVCTTS